MSLLAIDIGTSCCKTGVYSYDGLLLKSTSKEYTVETNGHLSELNPEDVWLSVITCIKMLIPYSRKDPVKAISISAMGDTFTPISKDGSSIGNSIVSFDGRAYEEALFLENKLGKKKIFDITGQPIHAMYPGCKMLWINRHKPAMADKVWKYLCYEEYILWKLGAEPQTSYSSAGRTLLLNIDTALWDERMLELCGIDPALLAKPVPSGVEIGTISRKMAGELNLPENVQLISGAHDQVCCAVGCAISEEGEGVNTTGTNEIVYFINNGTNKDLTLQSNLSYSFYTGKEKFASFCQIFNAGGAFRWFRDKFFIEKKEIPDTEIFDLMTANMPEGPTGIYFLPHLSGIGTPEMDYAAKGAIYGLMLDSDRFSLAKAIIEGICFELNINLEVIEKITQNRTDMLKVTGGAAKSTRWMRLKADITGRTVEVYGGLEPGIAGAAVLAGKGCGIFSTLKEGNETFLKHLDKIVYEPDDAKHIQYSHEFGNYLKIRQRLKEVIS